MDLLHAQLRELELTIKSKGLTMRKACELAGIPQSTVSRWTSKTRRRSPRMVTFQKLWDAVHNYKGETHAPKRTETPNP